MMSTDLKPIISEYLAKMGVTVQYDDTSTQFTSWQKAKNKLTGEVIDYPIAIVLMQDWIVIEAVIADVKHATADIDLEKLYATLLQTNSSIPELNYAMLDSTIISIAWINRSALTLDNFKSEFKGVISGAENFSSVVKAVTSFSIPPPKEFTPM